MLLSEMCTKTRKNISTTVVLTLEARPLGSGHILMYLMCLMNNISYIYNYRKIYLLYYRQMLQDNKVGRVKYFFHYNKHTNRWGKHTRIHTYMQLLLADSRCLRESKMSFVHRDFPQIVTQRELCPHFVHWKVTIRGHITKLMGNTNSHHFKYNCSQFYTF